MAHHQLSSRTDQVIDLLRQGMMEGRWQGALPGRERLAGELGCSPGTVEEALQRLTRAGMLVSQGSGRRRRIVLPSGTVPSRALRIGLLLYEKSDLKTDYLVELIHLLQQAGHQATVAEKTLEDLKFDPVRVARFVQSNEADGWVVVGGPRGVLEWFAAQPSPTFALFGRMREIAVAGAGPSKLDAFMEMVERLLELGHSRIVYLVRGGQRLPNPGFFESHFLELLKGRGIKTGPFNLPDWTENPAELKALIDGMFQYTPPTAMVIDEPAIFAAVREHLGALGFSAPKHISLTCCDYDPLFDWHYPEISHIKWDPQPIIRRVLQWSNNISRNKKDERKSGYKARFEAGGTIGPAPGHSG